MNLAITNINEDGWIFISHDNWHAPDGLIALIKSIQNEIGGKIIN